MENFLKLVRTKDILPKVTLLRVFGHTGIDFFFMFLEPVETFPTNNYINKGMENA